MSVLRRVWNVLRQGSLKREIDEEIAFHLEMRAAEEPAGSAGPGGKQGTRRFGNATTWAERTRDADLIGWMDILAQDLRLAVRMAKKQPGFTATVVAVLALGIGANTAIFSFVNAVLLQPLPYPGAERLVVPATTFSKLNTDRGSSSFPDFFDWKAQTDLFEAVAAMGGLTFDMTGAIEPERVEGLQVTDDYFRVMNAPPLAGRTFAPEENLPKNNRVIVISESLWTRRFGRDRKAIGATVELSGEPHRIIGVMRKDSVWPDDVDLWRPAGLGPTPPDFLMRRDNHVLSAVARLRPGVTIEQAQARLTVMAARIAREPGIHREGTGWKLHTLQQWIVEPRVRGTLWVLLGAVALVLLIACVNIANLLLARTSARHREAAIRIALGAGPARLVRLFLTESALLAVAGTATGLAFAAGLKRVLLSLAPQDLPRLANVPLDGRVLGFAAALCVATALAFGLAPALMAARAPGAESLREGSQPASSGAHGPRLRSALIVAEFTLTVMLLAGAGLLLRSFRGMLHIDPGIATRNVITMQVSLPDSRYAWPTVAAAFHQITESVRGIPDVISAAGTSALPVSGGGSYLGRVFLRQGQPQPPASRETFGAWNVIQPGYFSTMGIPIQRGRDFEASDTAKSNPVIIIGESMAREMFPEGDALGKRIRSWRDENLYREIVGIAGDTRYYNLTDKPANAVYVPHTQDAWRSLVLAVRTRVDPFALMPVIRRNIHSTDPKVAISEVRTMDAVTNRALESSRFTAFLLGLFAALALALAAVGIYGVMSYIVARRTREFGIRIALGACTRHVLGEVLGRSATLIAAGTLLGMAGAAVLTRTLTSFLYGVSPRDPAAFGFAAGLLCVIALAACALPAWRATRVRPSETLRCE